MKRRNTSAQSNYWKKALEKDRLTPILFSIWECLSFRPDKKPKHATSSIKPWLAVSRSRWHPKQGMPSQIFSQSEGALGQVSEKLIARLPTAVEPSRLRRRIVRNPYNS